MDRIEHGQLNTGKTKLPYKAARPLLQNFLSKHVIKLSSSTAAETMHMADGKHPARCLSHSMESVTPYVSKSAHKNGVIGYNLWEKEEMVYCTV